MTDISAFKRYFHVIRDIQRMVHTRTSVKEVLEVVVVKATEILNAKGALVRILNEQTNQFEVRAAWGIGERYLGKGPVSTNKLIPGQQDLHSVILIKDIWSAPRVEYPQQAWDEGIRMMMDVPLAIENQLVGLIRIYLEKERDFTPDELEFIVTVAEQCAGIIERVRRLEHQEARFTHMAAQVDKLSSLGRMAAGVAHEINNPLAGILLFSTNMRKKVPDGSPLKEGLEIIIKETQRCKIIIQGLLDFARDVKPQKKVADVNTIMQNAIAVVENEFRLKRIPITSCLAANMDLTYLDENQIQQVFINMLLNALQAVEQNGRVTVQSRVDHQNRHIEVAISDNGCGIAPGVLEKIFEPFFSTKANGTGLGLSVSFGIIENHQGEIQVFSEPGLGTRFLIRFPIVGDPVTARNQDEILNCSGYR
jgi:signal transduction histidine kinase